MSNSLDGEWPVLIVEDDPSTAELEAKVLKRAGKLSRSVTCSNDAIAALKREHFSAVLLDYLLAGDSGWRVLECAQAATPVVPVIVVTGQGNEEVAVEALRRGAADYVIKNGDYWQQLPNLVERIVKTAQAEYLRNSLATAVQSSGDAIVSISKSGRIENWNLGAERIFGISAANAVGLPIIDVFPLEQHARLEQAFEIIKFGDHVNNCETVCINKKGVRVELSVALSPIFNEQNKLCGISMSARDISERKRAEEQLQRTEFQLRQLQKLEAIREIAGGVAHEFNNLLTVIIVRSELMLINRAQDAGLKSEIELIIKTSERAASVAQQLLAFSGQQFLRPKPMNLNVTLSELKKQIQQLVGNEIALDIKLTTDPGQVKADPGKIEDVILNLARNSKDAMPDGGRLVFETSNIIADTNFVQTHQGAKPGPYLMLTITDTGCGMDAVTLSRIFEPFYTTKGRAKSSGLGLAMVYGTIKQSGGFIEVVSDVGMGSSFKIFLPCIDLPRSAPPISSRTLAAMSPSKTILVVEDTFDVLEIVRETLDSCGYKVLTANAPLEAIEIAELHSGKIDLLLTDVVMPEMSGTELAVRLEALQPEMKVIYMSGYPESHLGAHGGSEINFIPKPLSLNVLKRKVGEVISK